MRAISLWQPWASAMERGVKQNETRSWPTGYRGDLLICASKRKPTPAEVGGTLSDYDAAMALPYGVALCVVELWDCVPSELFHGPTPLPCSQAEAELGDYTPGRWIWRTRNLRRLKRPVPIRGRQGLWIVTGQDLAAVEELLKP